MSRERGRYSGEEISKWIIIRVKYRESERVFCGWGMKWSKEIHMPHRS